ncbi:thioredoxin family protein [Fibrella aquatilis]|uniref:Thioredoxin family protein n=1 Tax=Fibrella aquatilis TaxID=2817059 RepID=A0A939G459_9BACT|nr:thioredoxin family protein [Fibrella aquatilis]MBO0932037.1 thioredoxin family protein [Fibrella aquatilis]
MKTLILVVTLLLSTGSSAWLTNFEQAKTEATTAHKLILLNFSGSDWCGPCIKLKKEILDSDAFLQYATDKLVLVRADFPRAAKNQLDARQTAHNESLAERYNPEGKFPFTVLLSAEGKVLKTWTGYPASLTLQTLRDDLDAARLATH